MEVVRRLLSDLEFILEANENENVSETEIYEFIIEHSATNLETETLNDYYKKLAAAAISAELIKQDEYGIPYFEEEYIIHLLQDREELEYHKLFDYYLGKEKYFEYHSIKGKSFFIGDDLKIEHDILIKTFAKFITADMNRVLEKLKRHLSENITLKSCSKVINQKTQKLNHLKALKSSLLDQAFRGDL